MSFFKKNESEYPYTIKNINIRDYDYLDLGCSTGTSLHYGRAILGGKRGLGIDKDKEKINEVHERIKNNEVNRLDNAIYADILELPKILPEDIKFRFTTCIHFLEHLYGPPFVEEVIRSAVEVSDEFVYILQPNIDRSMYLFKKGLKTFFSDWPEHFSLLTSYDFYKLCRTFKDEGLIKDFVIFENAPIESSADPLIHPLSSPHDEHEYDSSRHPPKDMNIDLEDVYRDVGVFLIIDEKTPVEKHLDAVRGEKRIVYSSNNIEFENAELIGEKKKTLIDIDNITGIIGQNVEITAKFTDSNGKTLNDGDVVIKIGGKTYAHTEIINGITVCDIYLDPKEYSTKDYTITVKFAGKNQYAPSAKDITLKIKKNPLKFKYQIIPPKKEDANTKINVIITNNKMKANAGTVGLKINNKTYKIDDKPVITRPVNGIATFSIDTSNLREENDLTFTYSGCKEFEGGRATIKKGLKK